MSYSPRTTGTAAATNVPPAQSVKLPEYFHLVDVRDLIQLIADMLTRLTIHNDHIPLNSTTLTRFHSRAPPHISLVEYLQRIVRYAQIERICLLVLLIYIDRICDRTPTFTVCSLTVHRFVITGFTCASKTLCDSYLTNTMYAKVGGISTKELNILELEFLFLIDWHLAADVEILQTYYVNLVKQHPHYTRIHTPPSSLPSSSSSSHHHHHRPLDHDPSLRVYKPPRARPGALTSEIEWVD
ncbi:cyclin-domain-containing protein [Powellomyces hirtus]|nr:cyclin-domain-containing protein [Powellomyces hirtus]